MTTHDTTQQRTTAIPTTAIPTDAPETNRSRELSEEQALTQRKIINRLKRARGQLDAVIRAVEEGRDCHAIIPQISAVNSAVQKAGFAVISSAMRDCLSGEDDAAEVDQLEKLFLSLS